MAIGVFSRAAVRVGRIDFRRSGPLQQSLPPPLDVSMSLQGILKRSRHGNLQYEACWKRWGAVIVPHFAAELGPEAKTKAEPLSHRLLLPHKRCLPNLGVGGNERPVGFNLVRALHHSATRPRCRPGIGANFRGLAVFPSNLFEQAFRQALVEQFPWQGAIAENARTGMPITIQPNGSTGTPLTISARSDTITVFPLCDFGLDYIFIATEEDLEQRSRLVFAKVLADIADFINGRTYWP
jgi:hypothetical protein